MTILLHCYGTHVVQINRRKPAGLCGLIPSERWVFVSSQLMHRNHSTLWRNLAQAPRSLKVVKSCEKVIKGFCTKFL